MLKRESKGILTKIQDIEVRVIQQLLQMGVKRIQSTVRRTATTK